jgi:hypothetical protein
VALHSISEYRNSEPRFLEAAEADDLIAGAIAFNVTHVRFDPDDQYGARWVLTCQLVEDHERLTRHFRLNFPDNALRHELFQRMVDEISERDPLGPVVLGLATTAKGNQVRTMEDAQPKPSGRATKG